MPEGVRVLRLQQKIHLANDPARILSKSVLGTRATQKRIMNAVQSLTTVCMFWLHPCIFAAAEVGVVLVHQPLHRFNLRFKGVVSNQPDGILLAP